jgi:hypothetical protein
MKIQTSDVHLRFATARITGDSVTPRALGKNSHHFAQPSDATRDRSCLERTRPKVSIRYWQVNSPLPETPADDLISRNHYPVPSRKGIVP